MPKKEKEPKQRVRIKILSYDHRIIDNSCKQIIEIVRKYGSDLVGPIPLPTEIKKFTVNRDSFVHKDAREQFEIRVHKRVIDILDPAPKTMEALSNLDLPAGIDIEIKL